MKAKCHLIIYTESNYVRAAFESEWIVEWNVNGWKTAKDKDIANADEWKELYTELEGHKIEFRMVKTHPYKDWMEMEIRNTRKGD
jgi:ribonuclease HI